MASNNKDETNTIHGTTEVTIRIHDLRTVDEIAKQVVETAGLAAKIVGIDIKTDFEADDEARYWKKVDDATPTSETASSSSTTEASSSTTEGKQKDKKELSDKEKTIAEWHAKERKGEHRAAVLCAPLITILSIITTSGGTLRHFSWYAAYYSGTRFTRPQAFWDALYAHSKTLESLRLDYFEHEVLNIKAPGTPLPKLKKLILETSSAHGDEGTGVDALLKACPNIEWLEFTWPRCDLDDCQIQNISWEYTYPHLRRLLLSGYNFAAKKVAAFLSRHDKIDTLYDGIEWSRGDDSQPLPLKQDDLPKLQAVYNFQDGNFETYFDESANRPIRHVVLDSTWGSGNAFLSLVKLPRARSELKVLELDADVRAWRVEPEDSDSSDEDEKNEAAKPKYVPPPLLRNAVKEHLGEFTALRELGISLESDSVSYRRPDGKYASPDPSTEEDLKFLLTHLPPHTPIRALRLWDSCGEPLSQALLDDFPTVPESLEYLAWEAKEKTFHRIVREGGGGGGKVKAVLSERPRGQAETGMANSDWLERRVLEY